MKKFLSLMLAAGLALSLTACGGNGDAPSATGGAAGGTSDQKVLKVGMECNYAPYNWSQKEETDGAVAIANVSGMYTNGYDVQVAKNLANALGMKLEIYSYEWDSLVPAVQSGNLDVIVAGMSPTEERKEKIEFSDIYYSSNLVVITKKGMLDNVKTIADLDGKKIAAQSGTSHYNALSTQTTAQANEMADFSTMLIALDAGTIDGYVAEEPTAMAVCTDGSNYTYIPLVNNDTGFQVPIEDTSIAVGVKKGSDLTAKINEYLATFSTDDQKALMGQMVEIAPVE